MFGIFVEKFGWVKCVLCFIWGIKIWREIIVGLLLEGDWEWCEESFDIWRFCGDWKVSIWGISLKRIFEY